MPLVQITMLQGRSADQKRKIAQRITDAMVEEAGARREAIVVTFLEVSKESYASGGELMADKQKQWRAPCRQRRRKPARCPSAFRGQECPRHTSPTVRRDVLRSGRRS